MDGVNLAGYETELGLPVINSKISSCITTDEKRDIIQPYPLWPLKHSPGGTEDTLERGQESMTKMLKQMFGWETPKEPGLHPEYLKGQRVERLALWDPTG